MATVTKGWQPRNVPTDPSIEMSKKTRMPEDGAAAVSAMVSSETRSAGRKYSPRVRGKKKSLEGIYNATDDLERMEIMLFHDICVRVPRSYPRAPWEQGPDGEDV